MAHARHQDLTVHAVREARWQKCTKERRNSSGPPAGDATTSEIDNRLSCLCRRTTHGWAAPRAAHVCSGNVVQDSSCCRCNGTSFTMTVTVTVTSQRVTRHAKTPGSTAVKCVTVSTHTDVPLRMPSAIHALQPGTGRTVVWHYSSGSMSPTC